MPKPKSPKLTDTQLMLLSAAAQRENGAIEIPAKLRGGAARKVIDPLLARKLVREIAKTGDLPVWRTADEGEAFSLKITDNGLKTIGVDDEPKPEASRSVKTKQRRKRDNPGKPRARENTKQATVIAMLRRSQGATIEQITEATGWLPHTVRGFLAGALKKRLGLDVSSEKEKNGARVYAIRA